MHSPIRRAAAILGGGRSDQHLARGIAELARVAGVSAQAVHQWVHGVRPVPAKRAPVIAKATGVAVEDLCPDVPWNLVREQPGDGRKVERRSGADRRKDP